MAPWISSKLSGRSSYFEMGTYKLESKKILRS